MASAAAPRALPRRTAPASSRRRAATAAAASLMALFLVPGLVAAHPLGNFTINHYAGVRIEPDRILLDVVLDQAEIPAFQARMELDLDGDGELSDEETAAGRIGTCETLARSLELRLDAQPLTLELVEAGITFPPGAGGLETMRSVCGFSAALAMPIEGARRVAFVDRSFPDRLGWREIVIDGSEVVLSPAAGELRASSVSSRLTSYPVGLLTRALADTGVEVTASPGGPILPPLDIPDADPIQDGDPSSDGTGTGKSVPAQPMPDPQASGVALPAAAVPGGIGSGDLPSIFRTADLTPVVLVLSILTAAVLGAGHALTPGHGKTLMAAYLVGTRGTPIHAAGLGLSVALSHTLGILALAGLVTGAQGVLPPDVVVRTAPIVAAISIVAIGGWMLLGEGRRRLGIAGDRHARDRGSDHRREPGHPHDHELASAGPEHKHAHETAAANAEHAHGAVRHSHLPPGEALLSWRGLFVLGLAGGLIPSASALLILLGSIAAGRPAFGFVLVIAFGLGMAVVMAAIGLAIVLARGRLGRAGPASRLGRASTQLPLVASMVVLGFGIYLTVQALAGTPAL